ncbi:MAG TPA: tetratricopeptide repeat protein [Candidatus Acidoferrum sp.]|nr:tetratricopeptide repeat protein [Candidatus Acidoferrum sp.]
MPNCIKHLYRFGPFELDPAERLLSSDGRAVPVSPKAFDMLVVLVERSGHLCRREELMSVLWPDSFVEEGNLSVTVSSLRKVLHDDCGQPSYIETVSKRGYRFVASVSHVVERSDPEPAIEVAPQEQVIAGQKESQTARAPKVLSWRLATLAVVVVIATLFLARFVSVRGGSAAAPVGSPVVRSLAVLPFQTVGDKNGGQYVGIAMADALITKLGNTGKIVTRPTSAIQKYAGGAQDARAAGLEQGVDAVLDGRIQRDGDRVRLTVQLTRVRDGVQLWADSFDENFTDVFALEDEFSDRVTRSICLRLTGEAENRKLAKLSTKNNDAYQAYVRGRYFWNRRTEKALTTGLRYFQQAVKLDPQFAEAHAGVADSYALLGLYGILPPTEAFPPAEVAAKKALSMDDSLAEAHATLGFVYFYYDWNGLAAEKEFRRALESNPNYAMAHSWNGQDLAAMGRISEALAETQLAQQDDPLSLIVSSNAGLILCLAGRFEQAIETLNKAVEIDSNFPRAHFRLGNVYEQKGMPEKAISEFTEAVRLSGGDSSYEGSLGHAYALAGNVEQARRILGLLKQRSGRQYVPAYAVALIYAGLGDRDAAFEWLEKAYKDRSASMALLKVDPALNNLHSDPRFKELARRVSF